MYCRTLVTFITFMTLVTGFALAGETLLVEDALLPSWDPDGAGIVYNSIPDGIDSIWWISEDGENPHVVINDPMGALWPQFLPDGQHLVYARNNTGLDEFVIHDLESGVPVVWSVPTYWEDAGFTLSPDGSELLYTTFREIWALDLSDGSIRFVHDGEHGVISPDGVWLGFTMNDSVMVAPTSGGETTTLEPGWLSTWMPDSEYLIFTDYSSNLVKIKRDGTGRQQLTNDPNLDYLAAVSPSGHSIAFMRAEDDDLGPVDIYLLNTTVWYIATTGSDSTGDGSVNNPFATIQHGIDLSTAGDTVLVAPGTYLEHDIVMKSGINLTSETGQFDCVTIDAQQQGRVFYCDSLAASTRITGFTITGGFVGGPDEEDGAGMYCTASAPVITNCAFIDNYVIGNGGGLCCAESSSPTLLQCTFVDNYSPYCGGGICCKYSSPTLTDCSFIDNRAEDGGGLSTSYGSPVLSGCYFSGNVADYVGGAVVARFSTPEFLNCSFTSNSALDTGGVSCSDGELSLTNCTLAGNDGGSSAGGLSVYNSSATLTRSVISHSGIGAAIFTLGSGPAPILICCDLFGNEGGDWVGEIADQLGANGNFSADPLYCELASGDLTLRSDSPCRPGGNDCGVQIGAEGQGCEAPPKLFEDIAVEAGVAVEGRGRASGWGRIGDHDWDDLFVVVNGGASLLFMNDGDRTFTEQSNLLPGLFTEPTYAWSFFDNIFMSCWSRPDMEVPSGIDWGDVVLAKVTISDLRVNCCSRDDSVDPGRLGLYHNGSGYFTRTITATEVYDPDGGECYSLLGEASGWFIVNDPDGEPDLELEFILYTGGGCGTVDNCQPNAWVQGDVQLFTFDDFSNLSATWGNANGDRFLDLFVGNSDAPDLLYIWNPSSGSYVEVASDAGVAGGSGSTRGQTWIDVDGDGLMEIQTSRDGLVNNLYFNTSTSSAIGDISFTDIGLDSLGMSDVALTRSSSWADFDNDGDQDLYVVNLDSANKFYVFENGSCTEQSMALGLDDDGWGLGSAWGDFDNDGDLDLYLTNNFTPNRLFVNTMVDSGFPGFVEAADLHGVADPDHSRSCAWLDFDNDGDLDLHVLNSEDPDRLYVNEGGVFTDQGTVLGLDDDADCVSAAWADFDRDGDLDVYISKEGDANSLYENGGNLNNWLHVDVNWPWLQSWPAVGSRVRVVTGDLVQIREIVSASGYMSQHSLPVEFGFGPDVTTVDSLQITIPGSDTYLFLDLPVNQMFTDDPLTGISEITPGAYHLAQNYPNPFNPRTDISFYLPDQGKVDLMIYDISGRRVRSLASGIALGRGGHTLSWNGQDDAGHSVSSGVYFYRLSANSFSASRKMILLR